MLLTPRVLEVLRDCRSRRPPLTDTATPDTRATARVTGRNCKLRFDEQILARPYVQPMLAMLAAAIAAAKISFDTFAVISSSKTELWA
jgi:hypothetical protein